MPKSVTRLARSFLPDHYQITFDFNEDYTSFDGVVVIQGRKIGRPSQRLTFHQKDLNIKTAEVMLHDKKGNREVTVDRINHHRGFDEVRLHSSSLLHSGQYTVKITFSGQIKENMLGIYPGFYEHNKKRKKLIATQFESHHAREAFPCIDEPEAKAIFDLKLITGKDVTVLANTPVKKRVVKADQRVSIFESTPKMSTYLLAFVIGELTKFESTTKNGVAVTLYASAAQNAQHLAFAADVTTRALDFFEDFFGVPYPMAKADQVALPEFEAGAMENWGLITYRESCLLVDPDTTSIETKQIIAEVICHELSHQWFGNLVTMKWWDDLWLNESFANMMAFIAVDHLFPEWRIWEQYVVTDTNAALRRDALASVQPVRVEVKHPDEIGALFDTAIVYAKGGSLLRMLWTSLGDDTFRKGIQDYFKKHAYGNTTADDLWTAFNQYAKRDIGQFMKPWLNKPGYPVVKVNHQPGTQIVKLQQKRFLIGPSASSQTQHTVWPIPLASTVPVMPSLLDERETTVKLDPAAAKLPLLLNHEASSYFIPYYTNPEHLSRLYDAVLDSTLSTIDRLQLLTNSILLQRGGVIATAATLELLRFYQNETEEPVWSNIAAVLSETRRLVVGNKVAEKNLNQFIAHLVSPSLGKIGWEQSQDETAQILRLRGLLLTMAASAEVSSVLEEGRKRFKTFKLPSDLPSDIREVVYYIGSRFGSDQDFEKLLNLYRETQNADEKDELSAALLTTRQASHIKTLLACIKSDDVRLQDVIRWYARLVSNHEARALAWQWLQKEWGWLEEQLADGKSFDYVPRYTAQAFSRESELKEYQAFFAPKKRLVILKRAIEIGEEDIIGRVDWRKRNEKPVIDWLAQATSLASRSIS